MRAGIFASMAVAVLFAASCGHAVDKKAPAIAEDPQIEAAVKAKLKSMSLDDKVGQMMQFSVDNIQYNDKSMDILSVMKAGPDSLQALIERYGLQDKYDGHEILSGSLDMETGYKVYNLLNEIASLKGFQCDTAKMSCLFDTLRIGSILNALGGHATSPEEWQQALRTMHAASDKTMDIPMIYGLDQVHGTTYTDGGVIFPQHIGMAATFNPSLAEKMGEVTAYETRACGVPWIFCPDLDLGRKPTWSRAYEGMGEDPYLAEVMGVSYLHGLQGDDPNHIGKYNVGTCLKHYFGYGVPDNGLDRTPATITEQDLREKYFEPFKAAVEAGALSIMTNSSVVNGMHGVANFRFLTKWLKEELNWDGMILTDWADVENLRERDHIAATKKEGIAMAINAGVDMLMVTSDKEYIPLLKELAEEGTVPMSRIDDAVSRVLRLKYRLGLFDNELYPLEDYPEFASEDHAAASKAMALESEVLLKNEDGILPLKKGIRILVTGPNANTMRGMLGGWSYTWQGDAADEDRYTAKYDTFYEALAKKFGEGNVFLSEGVRYAGNNWKDEDASGIPAAVAAASRADVIIAVIGENSYAETTGNIVDANISKNQENLVLALQKTGKPVILVLNEGRPRIVHSLVQGSKAIVDVMLPGQYGGDALADLLAGDENFSGRLPFSYPSYPNSFTTYDFKVMEHRDIMPGVYDYSADTNMEWWFGDGLSYTAFEYSNLACADTSFVNGDNLKFTVDVKNTGDRAGKEVVMLYSTDLAASRVLPDNRRLRAFEKIELQPGESKTVTLEVPAQSLAYCDQEGSWILEKGGFTVNVGGLTQTLNCRETYEWSTPNR